jgi:hypothetical protein
MSNVTLVQARALRRGWELRRGDEVRAAGEPVVAVKMKSGFARSSGEVTVAAAVPEPDALVMALLGVYLILRRKAAAAAGAAAAVTATGI